MLKSTFNAISDEKENCLASTNTLRTIVGTFKEYKRSTNQALQFCFDLIEAQQGRSDYSTQAGVRSKAIIPSPSQVEHPLRITSELCAGF